jgi:glycosyltransferase involved in cell wall biosynthesis
VTGRVDDITDELRTVDVVAAAVRFGAGSPVKVVEAFAHRIPVVATPFALENLDARPGTHALEGASADEFAARCVELLTDPARRARLADAAEELYRRQYAADAVGVRVKTLVQGLIAGTRPLPQ